MKTVQSIISTMMFLFLVIGIALCYQYATSDYYQQTDPEIIEQLDRRIARNQSLPIAKMTREPIGYFDDNFQWVAFDRTQNAR